MPWIITKKSRLATHPYSGPTCALAGVAPGLIYADKLEAEAVAAKLTQFNAVGFEVTECDDEGHPVPAPVSFENMRALNQALNPYSEILKSVDWASGFAYGLKHPEAETVIDAGVASPERLEGFETARKWLQA